MKYLNVINSYQNKENLAVGGHTDFREAYIKENDESRKEFEDFCRKSLEEWLENFTNDTWGEFSVKWRECRSHNFYPHKDEYLCYECGFSKKDHDGTSQQ